MNLIIESLSMIALIVYFIFKNIFYILRRIIWNFRFPTWKGLKKWNQYHRNDLKGKPIYYDTIFHYYYDFKPKYYKVYPSASYRK